MRVSPRQWPVLSVLIRRQTSTRNKSILPLRTMHTGYCHMNAHYVGGVNNYLNSNHTKYLTQLCGRFFLAFLKISTANLRILWRHLPTEVRIVQCIAKHIWSSNKQKKQRPNRCIIGNAILPQTGTKLTKNAVLNSALCCGAI